MWECRVNAPKFEDATSLKGCNCEMISCLGLILNMSKVAAAEGLTQQLTMTTFWVQYCVTVGVEVSLWLLLMVQMSLWEFPLTGEGRDRDSELLSGRFFSLILPLIQMKFQPWNPNPVLTYFPLISFIFMYSSCIWFIKLPMDHKTGIINCQTSCF